MAVRLSTWTIVWLVLSSLIVLWDATYVMLRPRSMLNGDLVHIWSPYLKYAEVDLTYGWPAFREGDGWVVAQSVANYFEVFLNVVAVWMHGKGSPSSVPVTLVASTLTFGKTALYFLIEIYSGFKRTGHNAPFEFWVLFVLPSSVWLVIPAILMLSTYSSIADALAGHTTPKVKGA